MAKQKSSASSGTRRKHARKAAGDAEDGAPPSHPPQRGQKGAKGGGKGGKGKKGAKNEPPRKKAYIPPVKPAPVRLDPLDNKALNFAATLPPELIVVLRGLGKKAGTTKVKALEDLGREWIDRARREKEGEDGMAAGVLSECVPVWLHHLPLLLVHPLKRIRVLAATIHAGLLRIAPVRTALLFHLREAISSEDLECILGAWILAAHDLDRQVSNIALRTWRDFTTITASGSTTTSNSDQASRQLGVNATQLNSLLSFIQRAVLDPSGTFAYINPPPPAPAPPPPVTGKKRGGGGGGGGSGKNQPRTAPASTPAKQDEEAARSRGDEEEEIFEDRKARLRISGLGALGWFAELQVSEPAKVKDEDKNKDSNQDSQEKEPQEKDYDTLTLSTVIADPILWSALYHGKDIPWYEHDDHDEADTQELEAFGYAQPAVRRASWTLLQMLLIKAKEKLSSALPVLAPAVLKSAWSEPDTLVRDAMFGPLLTFLREFNQAWEVEAASEKPTAAVGDQDDDENEDDADDIDEVGDEDISGPAAPPALEQTIVTPADPIKTSRGYRDFLQFLELGCGGSPVQAYRAVLIVLSSIPLSIFQTASASTSVTAAAPAVGAAAERTDSAAGADGALAQILISLWAALDARALGGLDRAAAHAGLLGAILDTVTFAIKRTRMSEGAEEWTAVLLGHRGLRDVVEEQMKAIGEALAIQKLQVDGAVASAPISGFLAVLESVDDELLRGAVGALTTPLAAPVAPADGASASAIHSVAGISILRSLLQATGADTQVHGSIAQVIKSAAAQRLDQAQAQTSTGSPEKTVSILLKAVEGFPDEIFGDHELAKRLDSILDNNPSLIALHPELLLAYIAHCPQQGRSLQIWHSALGVLTKEDEHAVRALPSLLDAAKQGRLPEWIVAGESNLDAYVSRTLVAGLNEEANGKSKELVAVSRVLSKPAPFISQGAITGILESLAGTLSLQVDEALKNRLLPLTTFDAVTDLLAVLLRHVSESAQRAVDVVTRHILPSVFVNVFLLVHAIPKARAGVEASHPAKLLWDRGFPELHEEEKRMTAREVQVRLAELILDTRCQVSAHDLLKAFFDAHTAFKTVQPLELLPSRQRMDGLLDELPSDALHSSLAVDDLLVPATSSDSESDAKYDYDFTGLSSYARVASVLAQIMTSDRQLAKQQAWGLRHVLALSVYAGDWLQVYGPNSPTFAVSTDSVFVKELLTRCQHVVAYLLAGAYESAWHSAVVATVSGKTAAYNGNGIGQFVVDELNHAQGNDSVRDIRSLRSVLEYVLRGAEQTELEQWLTLARTLEKTAPLTACAIVSLVARFAPEAPRLDRYRNELAANTLGIPPARANTEGLLTLKKLIAAAPDAQLDVAFLPQLRVVNLVKACQQWVSSDEDIEEELESVITLVFVHAAPILQHVAGSHWDFVFDVVENNLENSAFSEADTLPTLARTLRLVILVQDLCTTNKALRAVWVEREAKILTAIRDLTAAKLDTTSYSIPRSTCRAIALSIVQDLPPAFLDETTLPSMCHLVTDTSNDVQKMAYQMLREAAKKHTEKVVVNAAVDTEGSYKPRLPTELLDILARTVDLQEDSPEASFGYFLAWALTFDLFVNASIKVKTGYSEHLRDLGLVSSHFLPTVYTALDLWTGSRKAFKLDMWSIDDFYIPLFDVEAAPSLSLFAAHVYYRSLLSVPSLIRAWVEDCKDRNLHSAVTSYTAQFFSPVILSQELAHVRDPAAVQELSDDNFAVKVVGTANEVTATYTVDERTLEMTLKMPMDWPLHGIEVRDHKRVGVAEDRWRAWMLGVQQIIWSSNGTIVDGLTLFKKNVAAHFEGLVECAICYSIIEVTDGTLPKKPCRTCKNRFHASCLYKWFNTSHSSSCPLCRSEIL